MVAGLRANAAAVNPVPYSELIMDSGIALRSSGIAPDRFIAVFHTGLGVSLLLAGLIFGRNYGKALAAKKTGRTAHIYKKRGQKAAHHLLFRPIITRRVSAGLTQARGQPSFPAHSAGRKNLRRTKCAAEVLSCPRTRRKGRLPSGRTAVAAYATV